MCCCCCCSTHVFLLCCQQNILQKNERTTSENEWNTRWITMRNHFLCVANELFLRIVCRTGHLKPFSNCERTVIYFRSHRVSLLFMGEIRVKARFSYGCTVVKATFIQWSKILTVCNIARVQAGYVLWLQLFCSAVILSHSDLQLSA